MILRFIKIAKKQKPGRALALAFCFALFLTVLPAKASIDIAAPYLSKGSKPYATKWIDHDFGKKASDLCVSRMQANGLASAIESSWGNAKIGKAIACASSQGLTGTSVGSAGMSGGSCAFNFPKAGDYANIAGAIGVDEADFLLKIDQNPRLCAAAGARLYNANASGGAVGSICNYFGGIAEAQYKATGSCSKAREILLLSDYIEASEAGTTPGFSREFQGNPDEDCYGCTTISGSSAGTVVLLGCHDPEQELGTKLDKATLAFQDKMMILASQETTKIIKEQESKDLRNYNGSVVDKYCLEKLVNRFDDLQSFLSSLSITGFIVDQILTLVEDILNWACEYTVQAIENALSMICLPLPTISLGDFSMPGLDKVYCDGVSMADFVDIERAAPVDLSGLRLENWGTPTERPNKLPFRFRNLIRHNSSGSLFQF